MMSVLLFYHHNDVISCKQEQQNRIESNLEDKEKQTCISNYLNPSLTQFIEINFKNILLFLTMFFYQQHV